MSQDLTIRLRKKENKKGEEREYIDLLWLCTTPAREISSLGAFPYTDEIKTLTKEDLDDYIAIVKEELNDYKEQRDKEEETLKEYKTYLITAQNVKVFEKLQQDMESTKNYIKGIAESIEEWRYYYDSLIFIRNIYNDNKEKWELCYINC